MASEDGDDAHLVEEDGYDALLDLRPAIVQRLSEIRLSSVRVSREHFVHWDPKVFMPGRIWNSISFPPDHDITDSNIYLFVAVLFYVDKTLRDGEPRVWKELNAAWDAKFSCLPGGRPEWDGQCYGSILFGGELGDGTQMLTVQSMADPSQTVRMHIWLGMSFDFAISGRVRTAGSWGEELAQGLPPLLLAAHRLFGEGSRSCSKFAEK